MKTFQNLEWDSNFFGIRVARIDSGLQEPDFMEVISQLDSEEFDLVYFNSKFLVKENKYYKNHLLDKRVSLIKELKDKKPWDDRVKLYNGRVPTGKMIDLSRRVAQSSRFFFDPAIPNEKVYEMYKIWLSKSVSKEMATDVLVYEDEYGIQGFATIKILDNGKALIPMLAVDRNHEGLGISFMLMQAIETFLLKEGCEYLISETKAKNLRALKVYERFGITCEPSHYINHLWRRKRE